MPLHHLQLVISVKILSDVTPGGDYIDGLDAKQVEDIDGDVKLFVEDIDGDVELFAAIGIKINPRKWVKKHESQIGKRDKLKLKVVVLHDGVGKEVHMTQSVRFAAENLVSVT